MTVILANDLEGIWKCDLLSGRLRGVMRCSNGVQALAGRRVDSGSALWEDFLLV